jgi:hypothetical protein
MLPRLNDFQELFEYYIKVYRRVKEQANDQDSTKSCDSQIILDRFHSMFGYITDTLGDVDHP